MVPLKKFNATNPPRAKFLWNEGEVVHDIPLFFLTKVPLTSHDFLQGCFQVTLFGNSAIRVIEILN